MLATMTVLNSADSYHIHDLDGLEIGLQSAKPCWIQLHLDQMSDEVLQSMSTILAFDPMSYQHFLSSDQRTGMIEHDNGVVVHVNYAEPAIHEGRLETGILKLATFPNVLVSVHDGGTLDLLPIVQRMKNPVSRLRDLGVGYLLYVILDVLVDKQFMLLETLDDEVEQLEAHLIQHEKPFSSNQLYALKRNAITMKRITTSLRELPGKLVKMDEPAWSEALIPFFDELRSQCIHLSEEVGSFSELLNNLYNIHYAMINNTMNKSMRILTLFSTIFIPLNFIAGLYGMNFQYMPELKWHYGYYAALGLMGTVAASLAIYFRFSRKV